MKSELGRNKNEIKKRLTAMLVAVVFVLGTAFVPSGIYAVEPDEQEPAVIETVEPETATEEAAEAAEKPAEDTPETAEAGTAASEEPATKDANDATADLSGLVVATNEDGDNIDIEELDESKYDGFIYKMKDDTTKKEIKKMEKAIDKLDSSQEAEEILDKELFSADSIETISEVAPTDKIEYIEPNYVMKANGAPNDQLYNMYSWQMEMTNIPYAWDKGMTGAGAVVAVLDSGVNTNHKDFAGVNFVSKYNYVNGSTDVTDHYGHGTAVAGIIAETRNNGIGFAGAMSNTSIMPVKIMDNSGRTSVKLVIQGMCHAVNNKADVINLSLGGYVYSATFDLACQAIVNEGVIIVAASGNEADQTIDGVPNPVNYPAGFDCVVSVGSVNSDGNRSKFSTYNDKLTVMAPGEKVCILNGIIDYYPYSGTSFSAPQVSALAAMMKSRDHSINQWTFMDVLKNTSKDLGDPGYDIEYGYGLIDYAKVFNYMATKFNYYSMSLSNSVYVYDGGIKSPAVAVSLGTVGLTNGVEYTASYAAGRKAVGTYTVTVSGINGFYGVKSASFSIIPPLVKGIKAPKRQKKKLQVRWKSLSKKQKKKYKGVITGYQVRVSTSSNFSNAKYVSVKGLKKTKATVKGLKRKTKYYVQYRSYKTVGSVKYYSKWSGMKRAKTK